MTDRSPDRLFPVSGRRLAGEAAIASVIAWAWGIFQYHLWAASERVPFISRDNDGRLIYTIVKTIAEQGWYTKNPDLGYPAGQQMYDFPHNGETWQLLIIKGGSLFTRDAGLLMNAYWFLGIALASVAALLALRHLRFNFGMALVVATAFTWLPFRLSHHQQHLFRVALWWVPLGIVIVLWTLHWRERFLKDPDPPAFEGSRFAHLRWTVTKNLRVRRVALMALMLVVMAGSETMTTAFTLTLLALTGVIATIRRHEPATLLAHVLVIGALGAFVVLLMAPTLLYVHEHGANPEAGRRLVTEQEIYGMKFTSLLLPDPSHRWHLLGSPAQRIRAATWNPSEGGQGIGLLGAAGFLGGVGWVLTRGWGDRKRELRPPWDRDSLRGDFGLTSLLAALTATISGGALFLSVMGFSQVRVWNRIAMMIGVMSMAYGLIWFERFWEWLRPKIADRAGTRTWAPRAAGIALVLVLLGGVLWDGGNVNRKLVNYPAANTKWNQDAEFVGQIMDRLPVGGAVFQLPVIPFPETPPPGKMLDYDHLMGFVHTPKGRLRWSYGSVRGRPSGDWQKQVDVLGPVASLPGLIGLGFDGLWVDTWGYADFGAELGAQLQTAIGTPPVASADGRLWFWDLAPLKAKLAAEGQDQTVLAQVGRDEFGIEPGT